MKLLRLTAKELRIIKKTFQEIFEAGKIYLFGSRVYDDKKGGDIDLYLILDKKFEDETERKMKFLFKLNEYLGEQKIDVVIAKDRNRLVERKALSEGIELNENNLKLQRCLNECR